MARSANNPYSAQRADGRKGRGRITAIASVSGVQSVRRGWFANGGREGWAVVASVPGSVNEALRLGTVSSYWDTEQAAAWVAASVARGEVLHYSSAGVRPLAEPQIVRAYVYEEPENDPEELARGSRARGARETAGTRQSKDDAARLVGAQRGVIRRPPPTKRTSPLVLTPEPEFVAGRPNVYGIYYANVNGWYIGKNETGVADYMGSPDREARKARDDAHAEVGAEIVQEKHMVWSPPDATVAQCRDQEWIWIARFRAEHDGRVFNVFPIQDWSNHFEWKHDQVTHVDRATNSRWPVVYLKLQARCDAKGNCSGGKDNWYGRTCGRPWGQQLRGLCWCKVVYPDGREEWLQRPAATGNPYEAFRKHKFKMINGGEVT